MNLDSVHKTYIQGSDAMKLSIIHRPFNETNLSKAQQQSISKREICVLEGKITPRRMKLEHRMKESET